MIARSLFLMILGFVLVSQSLDAQQPSNIDRYGDLLPPGAQLRMGTVRLRHTSSVSGVAFSPNGKLLASAGMDRPIRVWDVLTGKPFQTLVGIPDAETYAVAFSPNGARLASVSGRGLVRLWDVASGTKLFENAAHKGSTYGVAFSPDGVTFASAGRDGSVRLWDVESGRELLSFQFEEPIRATHAVTFSPDGTLLASGAGNTIRVWNLDSGEPALVIENAHGSEITCLVFMPDGKSLISSGRSKSERRVEGGRRLSRSYAEIHQWETSSGNRVREFKAEEKDLGSCSIAISADGDVLASCHLEKIRLWHVPTGRAMSVIHGYENRNSSGIAVSPDGATVAARGPGPIISMYETLTGERLLGFSEAHEDRIESITYSPDGSALASASGDGTVRLWNPRSGQQLRRLKFGESASSTVHSAVFSSDGALLAAGGYDHRYDHSPPQSFVGLVTFWEAKNHRESLRKHGGARVMSVALSSRGHIAIASGMGTEQAFGDPSEEATITIWESTTQKELLKVKGGQGIVRWMAFSPNGETLTALDDLMTVKRFGMSEKKKLQEFRLEGHQRPSLAGAAFTPDGNNVVTSGFGSPLLILSDLESGKEIRRIEVPNTMGSVLAISPDARVLASGSIGFTRTLHDLDSSIHLWSLASGEELMRFTPISANATTLAFSPDGRQLISGMQNGTLLVWNVSGAYTKLDSVNRKDK